MSAWIYRFLPSLVFLLKPAHYQPLLCVARSQRSGFTNKRTDFEQHYLLQWNHKVEILLLIGVIIGYYRLKTSAGFVGGANAQNQARNTNKDGKCATFRWIPTMARKDKEFGFYRLSASAGLLVELSHKSQRATPTKAEWCAALGRIPTRQEIYGEPSLVRIALMFWCLNSIELSERFFRNGRIATLCWVLL